MSLTDADANSGAHPIDLGAFMQFAVPGETAVQLYDDPDGDRSGARFVTFNEPGLRAGQFVIVRCVASGREFLGSVSGPQLNFNRNALSPTDNIAINQLEQINKGSMRREVAVKEVFFYEIKLLKEIVTARPFERRPESVRVRSQIGSVARAAADKEIIELLGLPPIDVTTRIGSIIDTEVPVWVSKQVLVYHTLVAGATGQGKTNTIANIIAAAQGMGMAVIVFDHKPDYQHAHLANEDGAEAHFRALADVEYWHIGDPLTVPGRQESRIVVAAHELDPEVLMATIFHRDGEELQLETCQYLLQSYIDDVAGPAWGMDGFKAWLGGHTNKSAPGQPDDKTWKAINRKINMPGRVPRWIDPLPGTGFWGKQAFKAAELIAPGRVVVIRVGGRAGREYALLLAHALDKIHERAQAHDLPCPVLVAIDEAQDIFQASKQARQIALDMLYQHIRCGWMKACWPISWADTDG
jgi:hypothetical protein